MEKIILVGYGGHAKSVADCIERKKEYEIAGYMDICECDSKYSYLGTDDDLEDYFNQGIKYAVVCIGYLGKGTVRQRLYEKLKRIGFYLPIIADPSSIVSETAEIGEGTFIGKNAIVNAGAKIGKMTIINTMALIEHECIVGDFAHVAVGATLCGQVIVEEAAFVGANATVIQNRKIESGRIVPAGAVIR